MNNLTDVDETIARRELARFFVIADQANEAPQMFSRYIDAVWHRAIGTPDYDAFCVTAVGHPVGHVEEPGRGVVSWVELYHERYGTLPAVWFADEHGTVDTDSYGRYLATRMPVPGAPPAAPFVTAWDCTPTTGDPDRARSATPALVAVG